MIRINSSLLYEAFEHYHLMPRIPFKRTLKHLILLILCVRVAIPLDAVKIIEPPS